MSTVSFGAVCPDNHLLATDQGPLGNGVIVLLNGLNLTHKIIWCPYPFVLR